MNQYNIDNDKHAHGYYSFLVLYHNEKVSFRNNSHNI